MQTPVSSLDWKHDLRAAPQHEAPVRDQLPGLDVDRREDRVDRAARPVKRGSQCVGSDRPAIPGPDRGPAGRTRQIVAISSRMALDLAVQPTMPPWAVSALRVDSLNSGK